MGEFQFLRFFSLSHLMIMIQNIKSLGTKVKKMSLLLLKFELFIFSHFQSD